MKKFRKILSTGDSTYLIYISVFSFSRIYYFSEDLSLHNIKCMLTR